MTPVSHPQKKLREKDDDPRPKQLVVGLGILGAMVLIVPAFYIVWQFVPGVFGEFLGVIAGVISTPFLLEISFIILGLIIVVALNNMRMRRNGDEFVYLEEVGDPIARADLPERSSFAIYKERPLEGIEPAPIDQIEGAIELGDHEAAAQMLAALGDAELRQPAVLELRLRLARETGKTEIARRIERELNPDTTE